MATGISRRRYARLVAFLTATMTDKIMSTKTRLAAANRLDDLYARVETLADRAEARKERLRNGEAQRDTPPSTPAPSPPSPSNEEAEAEARARALSFLLSIKGSGSSTHGIEETIHA